MTEVNFIIRHEEIADREFVYQVELDAFGQDNEARLVEALHEAGHVVLSLVAVVEDEVVGHILFSPMLVGTELDTNVAICLGPMGMISKPRPTWRPRSAVSTARTLPVLARS